MFQVEPNRTGEHQIAGAWLEASPMIFPFGLWVFVVFFPINNQMSHEKILVLSIESWLFYPLITG